MKSLIIFLSILVLIFSVNVSYGAFPIQNKEQGKEITVAATSFEHSDINQPVLQNSVEAAPAPAPMGDGGGGFPLGGLALILSGAGIISIIAAISIAASAAVATAFVPLMIAGFGLGLAGLIVGARAIKKKDGRGLGIGGLVLGIVDVSIVMAVTFLVLLIASFLK